MHAKQKLESRQVVVRHMVQFHTEAGGRAHRIHTLLHVGGPCVPRHDRRVGIDGGGNVAAEGVHFSVNFGNGLTRVAVSCQHRLLLRHTRTTYFG